MTIYQYPALRTTFTHFDIFSEFRWDKYRQDFKLSIQNGEVDIAKLRQEIELALEDTHFSWKEMAKDTHFVYYEDGRSEERILMSFKLLVWDIVFSEEALSSEGMFKLETSILAILREVKEEDGQDWLHFDELLQQLEEEYKDLDLNYYNLLFTRLEVEGASERIKVKYEEPGQWYFGLNTN